MRLVRLLSAEPLTAGTLVQSRLEVTVAMMPSGEVNVTTWDGRYRKAIASRSHRITHRLEVCLDIIASSGPTSADYRVNAADKLVGVRLSLAWVSRLESQLVR